VLKDTEEALEKKGGARTSYGPALPKDEGEKPDLSGALSVQNSDEIKADPHQTAHDIYGREVGGGGGKYFLRAGAI